MPEEEEADCVRTTSPAVLAPHHLRRPRGKLGVFSLLQSLIAPALPTVQHAMHTSQTTVTWVMTAYLLSASVFTPILGRVGDLLGKKRTLVAALLTVLMRLPARRARTEHRRPDSGACRPGDGRRPVPALLRHHP